MAVAQTKNKLILKTNGLGKRNHVPQNSGFFAKMLSKNSKLPLGASLLFEPTPLPASRLSSPTEPSPGLAKFFGVFRKMCSTSSQVHGANDPRKVLQEKPKIGKMSHPRIAENHANSSKKTHFFPPPKKKHLFPPQKKIRKGNPPWKTATGKPRGPISHHLHLGAAELFRKDLCEKLRCVAWCFGFQQTNILSSVSKRSLSKESLVLLPVSNCSSSALDLQLKCTNLESKPLIHKRLRFWASCKVHIFDVLPQKPWAVGHRFVPFVPFLKVKKKRLEKKKWFQVYRTKVLYFVILVFKGKKVSWWLMNKAKMCKRRLQVQEECVHARPTCLYMSVSRTSWKSLEQIKHLPFMKATNHPTRIALKEVRCRDQGTTWVGSAFANLLVDESADTSETSGFDRFWCAGPVLFSKSLSQNPLDWGF